MNINHIKEYKEARRESEKNKNKTNQQNEYSLMQEMMQGIFSNLVEKKFVTNNFK